MRWGWHLEVLRLEILCRVTFQRTFLDWKLFMLHLIPPFSLMRDESFALTFRIRPVPDPHVSLENPSFKRFRLVVITLITSWEGTNIPLFSLFVLVDMSAWVCTQALQPFHGLYTVRGGYPAEGSNLAL